ncbi:Maltose permease [Alternaria arborescens]|uniref:Maltose permease n=1 Tax=Alternaria arborescens TaxID=156630 RepID=A0A4Q4SR75_9PLEO|nr:Maltose permease [Alternaria arborescens]RYN40410.1 Maltose permease [Alternaria arborescens]RYO27041.1 Maltose permease [Alternaria arborescens]RYO73457.1 Maltose permease [Alternaria arborescens]
MASMEKTTGNVATEKVTSTQGQHNAVDETSAAINNEHNMSVRQSLRFWWKAIVFSFVISLCVVMEGYDTSLMNKFFAFQPFRNKFGDEIDADGNKLVSSRWQTIILNGTQVGCILGLIVNGYVTEWIGYKKTMIGSMLFMTGAIFIPFFSTGLEMFLVGGIIQGLPWGVFQTLAISYAADLCPMHLRGYMTSWINMCWVIGGLLSTGILTGLMKNTTQWGYRIPFALQWIWPIPIILATFLAPESPWWLVRQGRIDEAKAAIRQITTPTDGIEFDLDAHVEMMVVTDQYEKQVGAGTNYWHLFRGSDLHRTEVSAMAFITQALCGVPFMGFGTQFMQGVGLSQDDSFHLTIGQDCLGLVGCFIAWWIMTRFGRRPIYLVGLSAIFIILLIVGFIGLAPSTNKNASLAGGVLIILMIFCFQLSLGPICYSLAAEIPSSRLRVKTVALSRASYNSIVFVTNTIMPKMVGKNDWNWGAKGGFFWAGIALLFIAWGYFRLPEPKGFTYSELDLMFEHKVSARKFTREAADALKPALTDVAMQYEKQNGVERVESHA